MNPVYVVTDVEVDGPVPGGNSMLSFASVAVDADGRIVDSFCLRSFVAGRLGLPLWRCDPAVYPAEWMGHVRHTHRAIDDATAYAHLLGYAMARASP